MRIHHIQEVDFTIAGSSQFVNVNLDAEFDDLSKMVVMFASWAFPSAATNKSSRAFVSCHLISVTQMQAVRGDALAPDPIVGTAFVVQFEDSVNVYTGQTSLPAGGTGVQVVTANINGGSPMALNDTTKAFCFYSMYMGDDAAPYDYHLASAAVKMRMVDSSTVEFKRFNNVSNAVINWTVVESAGINVQHVEHTPPVNGGASSTVNSFVTTPTPFAQGKTFAMYSQCNDTEEDYAQGNVWCNGEPTLGTQVRFNRTGGLDPDMPSEISFQVIEDLQVKVTYEYWQVFGLNDGLVAYRTKGLYLQGRIALGMGSSPPNFGIGIAVSSDFSSAADFALRLKTFTPPYIVATRVSPGYQVYAGKNMSLLFRHESEPDVPQRAVVVA